MNKVNKMGNGSFSESPSIDVSHADSRIAFTVSSCSDKKQYSFYTLKRKQFQELTKRLRHLEKLTWEAITKLPREKGFSYEKEGTPNFKLIDTQYFGEGTTVAQKHYFHFRVSSEGPFRVFGYQKKQLFCITHIDPMGKTNH